MRDEIMRLAERSELNRLADVLESLTTMMNVTDLRHVAERLRALARTDHVEDKLGMVAEDVAEEIVESIGQTVGVSHGGWDDVDEIELFRAFHAEFVTRGMLASAPAPTFGIVPIKPGNWPEDSSHENGDYECECCHCGATFYGHKRRVTCKVCASPAPDHSAGVGGMVSAAKAVIQRWDSPLWREQTSTAALINDLREAVNALAQPVTAGADGGK